ncbi:hypothetical protein H8958_019872 [Nasalis larvatus]
MSTRYARRGTSRPRQVRYAACTSNLPPAGPASSTLPGSLSSHPSPQNVRARTRKGEALSGSHRHNVTEHPGQSRVPFKLRVSEGKNRYYTYQDSRYEAFLWSDTVASSTSTVNLAMVARVFLCLPAWQLPAWMVNSSA